MTTATIRAIPTAADLFVPSQRLPRIGYEALLLVMGTVLLALSAQAALVLPFSPVPVTGQTFAVLLIAATYGARRGSAAMLAYLLEGAAGLPVFAGWTGGIAHLIGPTGGYLAGFIAAAWLVGLLTEHGWDRRPVLTAIAMVLGSMVIFFAGLVWLAVFVPREQLLISGLWPFLPGAIVKITLATALVPTARLLLERVVPRESV